MYQLHTALARLKGSGYYTPVDVSDVPLSTLYTLYDHIYLHLTHTVVVDTDNQPIPLGLDLIDLAPTLKSNTQTVGQWLGGLSNQSLPTDNPRKTLVSHTVTYYDARSQGCYLTRIYGDSHPESEYPLEDRRNLLIQKPDTDYVGFLAGRLVTLAGVLHYSKYTAHGVSVPEAVGTLDQSGVDTVGFLDFTALGGVSQHRLAPEAIRADGNGNPLGLRLKIDVPTEQIGKRFGLVFMGRLIVDGQILRPFNDETLLFDLEQIDLAGLYQTLVRWVDLSALGLEYVYGQTDTVLMEDLRSEAVIRAMFTLPQTFLVAFEADRLTESFTPLANCGVSGRILSDHYPDRPLMGVQGFYADYWPQNDWGKWVLNTHPQFDRRYLHDTISGEDRATTSGHHSALHPRHRPHYRLHTLQTHTLEA